MTRILTQGRTTKGGCACALILLVLFMRRRGAKTYCEKSKVKKHLFTTQEKAEQYMTNLIMNARSIDGGLPQRVYYCEACGGWHITSKAHILQQHTGWQHENEQACNRSTRNQVSTRMAIACFSWGAEPLKSLVDGYLGILERIVGMREMAENEENKLAESRVNKLVGTIKWRLKLIQNGKHTTYLFY